MMGNPQGGRAIARLPIRSGLPVTVNQAKRLATEEWHDSTGLAYPQFHVSIPLRASRSVDKSMLEESLNQLVCRHSALRTAFVPNASISGNDRRTRLRSFSSTGVVEPGLYKQNIV